MVVGVDPVPETARLLIPDERHLKREIVPGVSGSINEGDVTVLYVDESGLAETAGVRLEREDDALTVVPETSLDGSLERLDTGEIDCVVWRYGASSDDGLEAFRIVRDRHGDLPFVLVTDENTEGVASEVITAGADEHFRETNSVDRYPILANRIRNVVDRHRARTAVERIERRYRTLVDVDPTPVALFDSGGTLIYINESSVRMMNADDASELMGKAVLEFVRGRHDGVNAPGPTAAFAPPTIPRKPITG